MWIFIEVTFIVAFFTVPAAMYWFNVIDEWVEKRRQRDEYDKYDFTFTGGERRKDEQDGYTRTIRCMDCPLYLKSQDFCMNCVYDIRWACSDGERKTE